MMLQSLPMVRSTTSAGENVVNCVFLPPCGLCVGKEGLEGTIPVIV